MGALACGSDTTGPGPIPADQLFWALHLNWNAVNLALDPAYNTLQLTATPVSATGASLSGAGPVRYRATDSTVTVDSTGLITAHYVTSQTPVVASLTVNGITLVDTAFVRVTQTDPFAGPITKLSIQAMPGGLDSAKVSLDNAFRINVNGTFGTIPTYVTMGNGTAASDTVCNVSGCPLLIAFSSSDPLVATLGTVSGALSANVPGHVTFRASTWAYGVGLRDSLPFVIGYRIRFNFPGVYSGGTPSHLVPVIGTSNFVIGVGGYVNITNNTTDSLEIVVDYQTPKVHVFKQPGGVTITDTVASGDSDRRIQFDSVGTYAYRVTLLSSGASATGLVSVSSGP